MSFLENIGVQPEENEPNQDEQPIVVEDNRTQEEIFMEGLPETLYLNHYEFHETYPQFTAAEWRRFLKDQDRFIVLEVAAITEANARKALDRLANGMLRQGDAAAITQLLNRSEQINRNLKDQTVYMTTFMPDPSQARNRRTMTPKERADQNKKIALVFYSEDVLRTRVTRGEIAVGADNLLHFTDTKKLSRVDEIYMKLYNPQNRLLATLEEGEAEWQ